MNKQAIEERVLSEYQIEPTEPVKATLQAIVKQYSEIQITDWQNQEEVEQADRARKDLVKLRNNIDKKRKELKAESLETGRAIDAIAKELTAIIGPTEEKIKAELSKAESEKARQQELESNIRLLEGRKQELKSLGVEMTEEDLLNITMADYTLTVENAREAIVAEAQRKREEAESKAAEERRQAELQQAREEAAREEREKIQREQAKTMKVVTDQGTVHHVPAMEDPETEYENYIERLLAVAPPMEFTEETARKFSEVREYLENQILTYA